MVMTMKELYKPEPKFAPQKVCLTVRVTNPRTKMISEFDVATTREGLHPEAVSEAIEKLGVVLKKWGYCE